ncbi:MAG TPA: protein translocase subunit SecD [Phycisphaerae bacterium]|nr:protein translocase subunit SecD [Phycisphaerae bacterium]
MNEKNKLWKWVFVLGVTALAIFALYPPEDRLKPGIDLAGGTSLIYEFNTAGMRASEKVGLAARAMEILKSRVDPNSQFNLVWRPIGNNRLEIQMPRPPEGARKRREAYEAAREKIRARNVSKIEIELALDNKEDRSAALEALVRGVNGRKEKLEAVATAWDAYITAREGDDIAAELTAQDAYTDAMEEALATNLGLGRLSDVLDAKRNVRETELDRLRKDYPNYIEDIDATLAAFDAWSKGGRGSLEDSTDLKRLLRGAGVLEFRILAERDPSNPSMLADPRNASMKEPISKYTEQLRKRGPRPKAGDNYEWYEVQDIVPFMQTTTMEKAEKQIADGLVVVDKYAGKYYVLAYADDGTASYGLTQNSPKWSLKQAFVTIESTTGQPAVDFQLDPRGGVQFAKLTKDNINRQLAIFLDAHAISHATIRSMIVERGQITGSFTQQRVQDIVQKLEAGSLPGRLKDTPLQEKVTGPSLGQKNREMGMKAAIYGLVSVVVFMLGYYLFAGFLADIALAMNIVFVLAIMAMMEATFTLPGIAGLLLTVGMAVDANVLIFERIREELARGVTLRKSIKAGYEKAFSTIVDANLTTLITCVILGYVGSEEVKGFAMTLGFGIVTSMFTALFVTRLVMSTLLDWGMLKSLKMLQLIGHPNVDWIGLRRVFWPVSIVAVLLGIGIFFEASIASKEEVFDIEFLGGTSVQIDLAEGIEMTGEQARHAVTGTGEFEGKGATDWLKKAAEALRNAKVEPGARSGEFTVEAPGLKPTDINALLRTTFEDQLELGGFSTSGDKAVFVTKVTSKSVDSAEGEETDAAEKKIVDVAIDLDTFKQGLAAAADYAESAISRLSGARVQTVSDVGAHTSEGNAFEVVTVESNKELVRAAILGAMGDKLEVVRPISFKLVKNDELAPDGMFPIREENDYLGQVIGTESSKGIQAYKGGVVFVFDELEPPQTVEQVSARFRDMRLQPQFEKYDSREPEVVGLKLAGEDKNGQPLYSSIAQIVVDENFMYSDDVGKWEESLAKPELEQATEALSAEKSLRKVVQFAPQVASQTQQRAIISLVLALGAIVAYVWIRFGTMQYGLAAIVALVHDVSITLGVITAADILGIGDFRIDLAMIAALLTVVGYSLNDTIVVFDRIRENRGKLNKLSANMINNSINMTLSRTLLTSLTTLFAVVFLFFMGGPGVHGFSFALLCGVVVGTYSSIGIAAPLLQNRQLLHTIVYILVCLGVVGIAFATFENRVFVLVVGVIMAILLFFAIGVERRSLKKGAVPA